MEKTMQINLDRPMKKFINKKVRKLGSMEAVKELYNENCDVDCYALKIARKVYLKKIKRRKKEGRKIKRRKK